MGWRWWETRPPKAEAPEDSREKPEESHAPTTSAPRQSQDSSIDIMRIPAPTHRCNTCGLRYLSQTMVLGRGFDQICRHCYVKEQAKKKAEREAKEREDDFLKHEAEW